MRRLATWILYVETGRVLLLPTPHVEKPIVAYVWTDPNAEVFCDLAAETLIDKHKLKAWCAESE